MPQTTELRAETAIEIGVGNTAVAIAVDSSNEVGIGTETPDSLLHVYEASTAAPVHIESGAAFNATVTLENTANEWKVQKVSFFSFHCPCPA